jgi:hypothetical protein
LKKFYFYNKLHKNKNMRSDNIFLLLFILFLCFISTITCSNLKFNKIKYLEEDEEISASIYPKDAGSYEIKFFYDPTSIAYAKYKKSLHSSGWDFLTLSSNIEKDNKYSDEMKAYASGYLEGYLTHERIWNHFLNTKQYYLKEKNLNIPENLKNFILQNKDWIHKMSLENKDKDDYWYHTYLVQMQLEGMIAGYNSIASSSNQLSYLDFSIINASNEIGEILKYYKTNHRTDFTALSHHELEAFITRSNHCSVLVKLAYDFSNIWFGHNTWLNYSSMTRIFKEYRINIGNPKKSFSVVFSSYPGNLSSNDDFYITDQDLYISETTSSIFNEKLYQNLTPQSVLTWQRVIVANRLSNNGKVWTEMMKNFSSGTLNNQWQVLDLKQIDSVNKRLNEGALFILEQIPGYDEAQDVTSILRYGYWPSYNSPYFTQVREIAGYDEILKTRPELRDNIDYSTCSRANIFRRDHSKVNSIEDMQRLMRYNDYLNDPLSKVNSKMSIACRGDLSSSMSSDRHVQSKPNCHGATDAKISSLDLIKGKDKKTLYIIAGPTTDQQIPFSYKTKACSSDPKYIFTGLPEIFDFKWIKYETVLFGDN